MSGRSKRSGSDGNSFNMWVSTNKVLIGSVGGPKKPHCRNPNFDCEETKLLISLWGDPQVQKTLVTTHKKHPVIAKLGEKMREYGYSRSTEEINTRIKNLKCFYNRIKKDLDTGVINETSWKHFQAMDEIMTRPIFGNNQQLLSQEGEAGPSTGKQSSDQVAVKLELVTDDDKEIRTDELLKNAEQVELKEPNLLIPKDEPMEDDDPNDPDFENDGDDEEDSPSEESDESDFDIDDERRKARLRRRVSRKASKSTKTPATAAASTSTLVPTAASSSITTTATSTATVTVSAAPIQTPTGSIKIINYAGKPGINISTIVSNPNVISASSAQNMTIVSATPTSTTNSTAGKISLVPTNFLLKPQTPNIPNVNFNSPIQLYTKPTVSISGTHPAPATAIASSGATAVQQPMKFLFVNTAGNQKQQLITTAGAKQVIAPTPLVRTTPAQTPIAIQPKPVITAATSLMTMSQKKLPTDLQPPTSTTSSVTITPIPAKQPGGFKSLLSQLVSLQRESLALSRTRMNVERERFANEKQIACSLVEALNDLNSMLQTYSSTVSVPADEDGGKDEANGESQSFRFANEEIAMEEEESVKDADASQDSPPVSNMIPVCDTIKAEVISDSD
ncbi:hypothetical protein quinque_008123 [Culex quinquefasciatus]|nr:uncharacterized protein LOC6033409 [Culex quinquefasciatus]